MTENVSMTVCLACEHTFEYVGEGPKLGPTCPACGQPAHDPKTVEPRGDYRL